MEAVEVVDILSYCTRSTYSIQYNIFSNLFPLFDADVDVDADVDADVDIFTTMSMPLP
jgi:hypothetical protein